MRTTALGLLGSALFLLVACSGGAGTVDPTGSSSGSAVATAPPEPVKEIKVAPPSTKLEVTATILSATLGDDCGSARGAGFAAGDCAGDGCSLACQQSNLQLSFKTGAGQDVKVEVKAITLHDAKTGNEVDKLEASSPETWDGNAYVAWDETLKPSSELRVSYDMSAPSWSTISDGNRYANQYKIRVTLRIDAQEVILESEALNREPNVAT